MSVENRCVDFGLYTGMLKMDIFVFITNAL